MAHFRGNFTIAVLRSPKKNEKNDEFLKRNSFVSISSIKTILTGVITDAYDFYQKNFFWSWSTSLAYRKIWAKICEILKKMVNFLGSIATEISAGGRKKNIFFKVQTHISLPHKFRFHSCFSHGDIWISSILLKNVMTFFIFF